MTLYPAVDIVDGFAVQLVQGVSGSGKRYGDPVDAALRWQDAGATWLHLVDLDAAFGRGTNFDAVRSITSRTELQIEVSGGIRDNDSLQRVLDAGVCRVNIGTAAIEKPQWCFDVIASHGDKIAVGLDVKGTALSARGWTRDGGDVFTLLDTFDNAGCARYVVTDINSDGMLAGPNIGLLRSISDRTDRPIIASGGVSTLDDLRQLKQLADNGVEGIIVGTALYEERFTLEEALGVLGD